MKKVENVGIGGKAFVIDVDAYQRLNAYLEHFRSKLDITQRGEVMDDLEARIAELLSEKLHSVGQVVNITMVEAIVSQLGMPDGSKEPAFDYGKKEEGASSAAEHARAMAEEYFGERPRRFYRDTDSAVLGGVCSGLSLYFNIDVVLIRILMVLLVICAGSGILIYFIMWLVAPKAITAAQKCEMRGWQVTAENMAKFSRR